MKLYHPLRTCCPAEIWLHESGVDALAQIPMLHSVLFSLIFKLEFWGRHLIKQWKSGKHALAFQPCLHIHRIKLQAQTAESIQALTTQEQAPWGSLEWIGEKATAAATALAKDRRGLYMTTNQNARTHGWGWLPILTRRLSSCKAMPLVLHTGLQCGASNTQTVKVITNDDDIRVHTWLLPHRV